MEYTSVKIPKVIAEQAKPILEKYGYRSLSEFINECARLRYFELVKG